VNGGLGSAVSEFLTDHHYSNVTLHRIGIPDTFVTHGTINELQRITGIDVESIRLQIESWLPGNRNEDSTSRLTYQSPLPVESEKRSK